MESTDFVSTKWALNARDSKKWEKSEFEKFTRIRVEIVDYFIKNTFFYS